MSQVIDEEFLEILRCPETGSRLSVLSEDGLARLNQAIAEGDVKTAGGEPVESALDAALITEDGKRIYRIEDRIPIMLVDEAILTEGLPGLGSD